MKVKKALPEQCSLLEDLATLSAMLLKRGSDRDGSHRDQRGVSSTGAGGYTERKALRSAGQLCHGCGPSVRRDHSQLDLVDIFNRQNSQPTSERNCSRLCSAMWPWAHPTASGRECIVCGEF